jgi:3-hydroxyacyl-CoA dehydrogenase
MKYKVHKAVVIGAGTMGAAIAAHLANAGIRVTLLDIVPRELTADEEKKGLSLDDKVVRNRIVDEGLKRALKSRPASFFTPEHAALVTTGNLEDDFDVVCGADFVIEAIIENLEIKRSLMTRIDEVRAPHSIIGTNTSGIPVASIAAGFSESFRQHFLGTHFFNPPRYLKLVEIIPTLDTLPEVVEFTNHFCEYRLGKGVVPAKDTPNFIANRLFAGTISFEMDYILEHGYTVDEVDVVTGPPIGHPKTATFRLIDLVGLDVWGHVSQNLIPAIPHDEHALRYMESDRVVNLFQTMIDRGWYGTKVKEGFYKLVKKDGKKEFWPLNLETLEHQPATKPRFDSIGEAKDEDDLGDRLKILIAAEDRAGELVRALTYQSFAYASELIPEVADTPKPMDDAMRWGFGHEAGPFETWDMLGVAESSEAMKAAGFPPAPWVDAMLINGHQTFYQYEGETKVGVYNPETGDYEIIKRPIGFITLKEPPVISKNLGATLRDIGDGVACVEFHTKMNALEEDIFDMLNEALDRTETDFDGLVVGNEADNFSAGANLFMVVMAAQNELWDELESSIAKLQNVNMRMRYFPKPVVTTPAGLVLGGGAEVTMHGSRIVAAAETYMGQVEIGVGVIPAGGGIKELLRRILNPPMKTDGGVAPPYLQQIFELIGMAKVATSAEEARKFGFLSDCDRVVMNRSHLLAEAKKEALHMNSYGYRPPLPEKIYAAGRDGLAALRAGVFMFKESGYITEYESLIGEKLAYVMCGGELSQPAWVDEQYILDLEREAFLSLCGEEMTQERMWHMLQKGKPLRN